MTTKSLTIPAGAIDGLRKAYNRIIRNSKKLGYQMVPEGMKIDWSTKREIEQRRQNILKDEDGEQPQQITKRMVEVVDVTIDLPEIGKKTGKWEVAGVLNRVVQDGDNAEKHIGENEVFSSEPAIIETYRHLPLTCAHCGTNRYRVKTLVCREISSGRLLQLGLECAVHYVGDAEREVNELEFQEFILSILDAYGESAEEEGSGCWGAGGTLVAYDADEVVAQVICVIRKTGGYVASKLKSHDGYGDDIPNPNATWRHVGRRLAEMTSGPKADSRDLKLAQELDIQLTDGTPMTLTHRAMLEGKVSDCMLRYNSALEAEKAWIENQPTAEDLDEATKIIAWLASVDVKDDDKFMIDLKSCFSAGWVSTKKLGFACCITRCYDRAMQAEIDAKNPPTAMAPEGRVLVEGKILSFKEYTNDFGPVHKMLVKLTTGSKVFCSVPAHAHAKLGETIRFVATFERSKTDPYFSVGKIPKLPPEPKVKKAKKADPAQQVLAVA